MLKRLKPQTCPLEASETEFQSKVTDPKSRELVSEAGLKNWKLYLQSLRQWGSPEGCEDADRPLDLHSVRHSSLQFWLAPTREGSCLMLGEQVADSLLRYLDAIPHGFHGGRLGSWLEARSLVVCPGLGIQEWQEVPSAHHLSVAPSAAAFCIGSKTALQSFQEIAGPSESKIWERPNLTLGCSPWS